jgi:hypothetical protein
MVRSFHKQSCFVEINARFSQVYMVPCCGGACCKRSVWTMAVEYAHAHEWNMPTLLFTVLLLASHSDAADAPSPGVRYRAAVEISRRWRRLSERCSLDVLTAGR